MPAGKRRFLDYVKAAFNARPWGMFVPPNWIGLGAFGLLGLLNPGFWILGAGLELAYLHILTNSGRFRRWVDNADRVAGPEHGSADMVSHMLNGLPQADLDRYARLVRRCRQTLAQVPDSESLRGTLARLGWVYLQILAGARKVKTLLENVSAEESQDGTLTDQLAGVESRLSTEAPGADLRHSLESRRDILRQRLDSVQESQEKVRFFDSELERLEDQVGLLAHRATLDQGAASISAEISRVSAEVSGATDWMARERQLGGGLTFLDESPPPEAILES